MLGFYPLVFGISRTLQLFHDVSRSDRLVQGTVGVEILALVLTNVVHLQDAQGAIEEALRYVIIPLEVYVRPPGARGFVTLCW